MFKGIGLPEIILILVIVMIFFGAGKLPDVASGIGKAMRNFKKGQQGVFDEEEKASQETVKSNSRKVVPANKVATKAVLK
jgi:sec-independent protein translocase protein TatA